MNHNDRLHTPFTETLPTALPYLPPRSRQVSEPVLSEVDLSTVESAAVASHRPRATETGRRLSATRITIALFTLGLSIPFVGIRRTDTTRNDT